MLTVSSDVLQDTMISEHEILENGSKQQRCQVVRWVRTFPFSFLSKREYIIGRRMWRSPDGCLYGITKVSSLFLLFEVQSTGSGGRIALRNAIHRKWWKNCT